MSWDNFNESGDLKAQVEAYYTFTGYYPESVHADRIYRTRENRAGVQRKRNYTISLKVCYNNNESLRIVA
jgi:hypothetical protein